MKKTQKTLLNDLKVSLFVYIAAKKSTRINSQPFLPSISTLRTNHSKEININDIFHSQMHDSYCFICFFLSNKKRRGKTSPSLKICDLALLHYSTVEGEFFAFTTDVDHAITEDFGCLIAGTYGVQCGRKFRIDIRPQRG